MLRPPRIFDVTPYVDPEKLGLPAEEMAVLDEIAPTRIAYVRLARVGPVCDVRILGGDEGFAVASKGTFFQVEFTTVLDDGYAVTTVDIRPQDTRAAFATILQARRADPGCRIVREKSPKDALARHVAFVREVVNARETTVRQDQDKALYFEFRRARNVQIRQLGYTQIVVASVAATIYLVAIVLTLHKSKAALLAWAVYLLFFWVGGFVYAWARGRKPLLESAKK